MSTAIPGYKMGITVTPYNSSGVLQPNQAFTAQIEDQEVTKTVEMDEISNSQSNGFYEGVQVLTKGEYSFTAVLDGALAFDLEFSTQQSNKLATKISMQFSKGDANPWTYSCAGAVTEIHMVGAVKKAWRIRGRLQVNGDWVASGVATGSVTIPPG